MKTSELDSKLIKVLEDFADEMQGAFESGDKTPATKDDLDCLARNVHHALNEFRKSLRDCL